MEVTVHNPTDDIYPADDFVHAIELVGAKRIVYVSGTMGLNPDWTASADIDEQLSTIWKNIAKILSSANMTLDNIVRLTSYLSDRKYASANGAARVKALGGRKIPTTAIVVQMLDDNWLVEIEVIAAE